MDVRIHFRVPRGKRVTLFMLNPEVRRRFLVTTGNPGRRDIDVVLSARQGQEVQMYCPEGPVHAVRSAA